MILIPKNMADNLIIMRGLVSKFIFAFFVLLFLNNSSFASEKIGIVTDTILTPVNYYNAYFRTPEFFALDVRGELINRNVQVVPMDVTREALKKAKLRQYDLEALQGLQQGYKLEFPLLKKIASKIGVNKLIVITMGMDVQRDFLKNTLWNSLNIPGFDVVNPTHRVSVYVALVDVKNETMIWETIYAKNIRNNKLKNLDTTISNNYEGMLRLKEYSKYISTDIAYNVKMKMINPKFVEAPAHITKENLGKYAIERYHVGSKKELTDIRRQRWDTEKLKNDTKENIREFKSNTKTNFKNAGNSAKSKFTRFKDKLFKKDNYYDEML